MKRGFEDGSMAGVAGWMRRFTTAFLCAWLVACGGGGGGTDGSASPPFGGTGSGGGGTSTSTVTVEARLVDATGNAVSSVLAGQPVRAVAVVRVNGVVAPDQIVQFAAEQSVQLVRIDPSAGSQLTDSTGTAAVTVSSLGTDSGAGRITATATVSGVTASSSANFFASGSTTSPPSTLALSQPEIGSAVVSAYGTTGVKVRVLQGGAPYTAGQVTVNFTTSCPVGKATITPSAATQPDAYAVATFVDNGCAQTADSTVTITASIATDTKSGSVTVKSPTTGSLRFVSVVPSDKSITLRGQGGNGRQENATVTFKLVDVAGQGVGDTDVCFDSTTYVGGLNVDGFAPDRLPSTVGSTALCGTDVLSLVRYVKRTNADGTVTVQVNSGTVPTPVRVRARALYPALSTTVLESFSDTLSVSTGLPLQRSFSLSADMTNIDGGNVDGQISTLTVRLADQFSNPVPDGTVVNFIGSGGAVCTSDNGSCKTTNGQCSCQVVSQARRPLDNRVVILAYAVGLEDFDDKNGSNLYEAGVDTFTDLGDAYVDADKNGRPDPNPAGGNNGDTDILIPYQKPSVFTAAGDGVRGTAHIRASTVVYFSQSSSLGSPTVVVPLAGLSQEDDLFSGATSQYFLKLRPVCPKGTPVPQATLPIVLDDGIGNPMAAGTTLDAVDVASNISSGGFIPSTVLAIGARAPSPLIDLPNVPKVLTWTSTSPNSNVTSGHAVTISGVEDKCSGDASFALQVKSPTGGAATARILYDGESRLVGRSRFDVRYRDSVNFSVTALGGFNVNIGSATFVPGPGSGAPTAYSIAWGDGTTSAGTGATILPADRSHTYVGVGARTVTLTVTAGGVSYSSSQPVTVN